LARLL
jgi:hypothetical protein